jgi:electron transport complex protein RnfC
MSLRRLWKFAGGLRLPGYKDLSAGADVRHIPTPARVVLPLQQHVGAPAQPVVQVGDRVDKGQPVAEATSFISAPVHASVSGRVVDIGNYPMPHPSGIPEACIVIENDGEERWWSGAVPAPEPDLLTVEQLRDCIRHAGIVGLGGAAFPSAAKLSARQRIATLIINGVECEPYITCDDMLMRTRAREVVRGTLLLRRMVDAERCILAVEDNKPEAAESLRRAVHDCLDELGPEAPVVEVVAVPTRFPAGGEKQLIKVLTGKEIPEGGLPYEVGALCVNVGTAAAVHDAVYLGRPLISRLVTVTGSAVREPGNFNVPIGTPLTDLLAAAGGTTKESAALIMGGPMMGHALPHSDTMVVKGSNCILVQDTAPQSSAMPCIRCGSCAEVCPMKLLPQQLYWHARGKQFDKLEHYGLRSCIECGCCAVACPANIPLVAYFRFAKTEIRDQAHQRERADESRRRNEARKARLEAQKREQAERKAKRKAARGKPQPHNSSAGVSAQADLAETQ